ncbi:MAG: hypothetical protein GQ569_10935 [Methylococcaceae bacterium]|nr:hypothetical protein [Methylococcaceae bacterium]
MQSIKYLLWIHVIIVTIAVITAYLHSLSLNEPSYTKSGLIFIGLIATVLGLLLILPNLIAAFYLLVKKKL